MAGSAVPTFLEGVVDHKTSNALRVTFRDGPGDPIAIGIQGAGDGRGKKLGILFGFKNGGAGNHVVTFADGRTMGVASRDGAPTELTIDGGTVVVQRGPTSTAIKPDGTEILRFLPEPEDAVTAELFRMRVVRPASGEDLGRLDIIRRDTGWTVARVIDAAWDEYIWWDRAGRALPIPILGSRATLTASLTELERDVLLGACTDITLGLRPYFTEMG